MEFVQKNTPPDFQAKHLTPSISPNFNSFGEKKTKKMCENGKIYTAGKNFTPPYFLKTSFSLPRNSTDLGENSTNWLTKFTAFSISL